MNKRGPKPKTAATSRRKPAAARSWTCPGHLDGEARIAWDHAVRLLGEAGNLDRTDPTLVEAYAIGSAMLRKAYETIAAEGVIAFNGQGGMIQHPAAAVVNSTTMRLKAIINELGLSPASSKYAAGKPATTDEGDSQFRAILGIA